VPGQARPLDRTKRGRPSVSMQPVVQEFCCFACPVLLTRLGSLIDQRSLKATVTLALP